MKLLFDHNISHKLVGRLVDLFPDSDHVRNIALHEADDRRVWEYARAICASLLPGSGKISLRERPEITFVFAG